MKKCLSVCFIAATVPFVVSALLAAAKLDTSSSFHIEEQVQDLAGQRLQGWVPARSVEKHASDARSLAAVDGTLLDGVADNFHSLQGDSETSSGWVSLPLASSQPSGSLQSQPAVGLRVTRVAQVEEAGSPLMGDAIPASYVYRYNAVSAYLTTEEHQLVEQAREAQAGGAGSSARYSF